MKTEAHSHIKLFRDLAKNSLTRQEARKAVTDLLTLPWMKRFQVFSDQAVILYDLYSSKYLYVSPTIMNVTGYSVEEFKDFQFVASLMSTQELEIAATISGLLVNTVKNIVLQPSETFHSTRNVFFKRKDGALLNALQHGFTIMRNSEGLPAIEMLIMSDITSFNPRHEHFYSLARVYEDGSETILISGKIENTKHLISPREQEVLKLISLGNSSRAIAGRLHISIETIKTHRKNLLGKTNSKNSIDLVRHGYAYGWL